MPKMTVSETADALLAIREKIEQAEQHLQIHRALREGTGEAPLNQIQIVAVLHLAEIAEGLAAELRGTLRTSLYRDYPLRSAVEGQVPGIGPRKAKP